MSEHRNRNHVSDRGHHYQYQISIYCNNNIIFVSRLSLCYTHLPPPLPISPLHRYYVGCVIQYMGKKKYYCSLVLPGSGSEPRFGPEPFRTGPKSGSKFGTGPEPDPKSGPGFGRGPEVVNRVRTEPDLNLFLVPRRPLQSGGRTLAQSPPVTPSPHLAPLC